MNISGTLSLSTLRHRLFAGVKQERAVLGPFFFLLLVIIFAPIVRVASIPLPTVVLFSLLVVVARPIYAGKKEIWVLGGVVSAYLLSVSLLNSQFNPHFGIKDLAYFALPIQVLLTYLVFYNIFVRRASTMAAFDAFCIAFMLFEAVFVVVEYLNIRPIITPLTPYLRWFLINVSGNDAQVAYLNLRPGGTLGNPVLLGMTAYIVGRHLTYSRNSYWFLFLGMVIVLLTASRTAFVGAVLAEAVLLTLWPPKKVSRKALRDGAVMVLLLLGGVTAVLIFVPFMRVFLEAIIGGKSGGLQDDYSATYRTQIMNWAFSHQEHLWFGGLSLAEAPDAVDSEIIMRSLQFGGLGYLLLQFPIWALILIGYLKRSTTTLKFAIPLFIYCVFCSLPFSPFSHPYLLIWYGCLLAYWMARPTDQTASAPIDEL